MGSNKSVGYQQIQIHINHPKLTNAKIYTNNSVSKLISQLSIEQNIFKAWQKQLSSYHINSQFAFLPEKADFSQEKFCSIKGSVKITYDNFPYLLRNQIYDRIGKRQPFCEEELWYLLLAIFSIKKQFSQLGIHHGNLGNVNPQNIFLSSIGEIKVGNYLSWPGQQETMQKLVCQSNKRFIAPQDFIQLSLGMTYCKNTSASQIFSIGLTVLSAGILKDNFQLYNYHSKKFNFNQALIRIKQWKDSILYSDVLKALVELLCSFQASDRLKMSQIGDILFRCENSIKSKKKFSAYPLCDKIQSKIKQYKSNRQGIFNSGTLSTLSPMNQYEMIGQSPTNSKFFNMKKNSLNLTQVIFGPNTVNFNEKKSSNNSQSLMSSVDQVTIKKTQSQPKQQKPLQRYQQINANYGINSLSDIDYLNLITMAKQIIIQKPIIVDANRRSDDIQEQTTPVDTPTQTPINRSNVGETNGGGFKRNFQVPKQYSKDSLNLVQKNPLYKTTHLTLHPNHSYQQDHHFRVKSTHSHDQFMDVSRGQDLIRTNNSTTTMYIPLDQGLRQSWDSQRTHQAKKNIDKISKKVMIPSQILQNSKECSQIQLSKLSGEDKQKIQSQILQKIQNINVPNKKLVKFAKESSVLDLSHESRILQIDDIDLDYMQDSNKWSDKIIVGYKQPNEDEIVIESVNVSKKNSFVHVDEDVDD